MKSRKHRHLIKHLLWRTGPEGLYPEKLFWMEGKDLEGASVCYSYQFVKKPGTIHPIEGMVCHPYDEVLCFASVNRDDVLNLGAKVSVILGEEQEEYSFEESHFVCVPAGLPHAVRIDEVDNAFVHFTIGLSATYKEFKISRNELKKAIYGERYRELVKLFVGTIDPITGEKLILDPNSSVDARGVRHPVKNQHRGFTGPGNADNLLWIYGPDCMNFNLNFLYSQCSGTGIWHRGGTSHSHPEEEILIFAGQDPQDPMYLGAEVEIAMGEEDERYAINTPSVFIMPRGFSHLPQTTRWCDSYFAFMVASIESMHGSPWKNEKGQLVQISG